MTTLRIKINLGNAAFADAPATELGRVLRDAAQQIEYGTLPPFSLRDINGNTVGSVEGGE